MRSDAKVLLFFLEDGNDTPETREAARALRDSFDGELVVRFRNGTVPVTGAPEKCDFVGGFPIPDEYSARFPVLGNDGSVKQPFAPSDTASPDINTPPNALTPQSTEAEELAKEVGAVGGWGAPPQS
jgi:hypothetical protein